MDELVKQISTRTGISEDQARQAAQMAVDFIKQKLPENMRGQVDMLLSSDLSGVADQAEGLLGGMFGKK